MDDFPDPLLPIKRTFFFFFRRSMLRTVRLELEVRPIPVYAEFQCPEDMMVDLVAHEIGVRLQWDVGAGRVEVDAKKGGDVNVQ
jgi:predicted RecB family endonuclease